MTELEELRLAYAECSRQRNELLTKLKLQAQSEPVAWGWAIMHSDGTEAYVRPRIRNFFGAIQETEPFSADDVRLADKEWAGLAPHCVVTLYTQPAPVQQDVNEMIAQARSDALEEAVEYALDACDSWARNNWQLKDAIRALKGKQ